MLRRPDDRAPQLVLVHRPDVFLVARDRSTQAVVGGDLGIEVGAQRDHDANGTAGRHGGHQVADERRALRFVLAEREQLLELVDNEDRRPVIPLASLVRRSLDIEVERSRFAR